MTEKEGMTMMTNLMGAMADARVNELHAAADRQRTVLLARTARRAQRAERASGHRHGRVRWVPAHH